MNKEHFKSGSLVRHRARPGVWRILGTIGWRAEIEPFDDLAGGSLHASEAYAITVPSLMLDRLVPASSAVLCS